MVEHGEDGLRGQPVQLLHRGRRLRARQRPPLAVGRPGVSSVVGSFVKLTVKACPLTMVTTFRVTLYPVIVTYFSLH